MKFWMMISCMALGLVAAAAELNYSVDDRGALTVQMDGRTLLDGETLQLMDAEWGTISAPLKAQLQRKKEGNVERCIWASDRAVVSRSVEKLADGRLRIGWSMKFVNGIPGGRYIELSYFAPRGSFAYAEQERRKIAASAKAMVIETAAGKLNIEFSGASTPWAFEDMRSEKWHGNFRLILGWNYDPAAVNVVESTMVLSGTPAEGK